MTQKDLPPLTAEAFDRMMEESAAFAALSKKVEALHGLGISAAASADEAAAAAMEAEASAVAARTWAAVSKDH